MSDSFALRLADPSELDALAAVAARCQPLPERHCTYASSSAEDIAAEVSEVDRWSERTVVAVRDDRVLGWILADADDELGRVWWWGPFLDPDTVPLPDDPDDPTASADVLADALLARGRELLPDGIDGEELAIDERSDLLARLAGRNGFQAEEASACLELRPGDLVSDAPVVPGVRIEPLSSRTADAVAALHDLAFPGTHTTGRSLVDPEADTEHRWVAVDEAGAGADGTDDVSVVGYVATERHQDGSCYVDFLAVDPARRGAGIGRALVHHASRVGLDDGATYAHLTVRVSNAPARALYDSLGYRTDRIVVPYRRGFSLGG